MRRINEPGGLQKPISVYSDPSARPTETYAAAPLLVGLSAHDPDQPGVATDFAVLHERAVDIRLDKDFALFAAVRAGDGKVGGLRGSQPRLRLRAQGKPLRFYSKALPDP